MAIAESPAPTPSTAPAEGPPATAKSSVPVPASTRPTDTPAMVNRPRAAVVSRKLT